MSEVFDVRPAGDDEKPASIPDGSTDDSTASARRGLPSPIEHLVDVATQHQIVLLGDQRGVAQHVRLLAEAVPELHRAGVGALVWEFTNSRRQDDVDALLSAPEWDRRTALALFVDLMGIGFGYEEYVEVLEAIWRHNRSLPEDWPPFRLVAAGLPSYVEDPDLLEGRSAAEIELRNWWLGGHYRDVTATHLANIVTQEVVRHGLRAVVYADADRTETELIGYVDGRPSLGPGVLLANWMGAGVARVVFHGAVHDVDAMIRVEELIAASPDPESSFGLALERSTLGNVRVHDLQGVAHGSAGPFDLGDLAHSYLFVAPREQWTPVPLAAALLGPDTLAAGERRYRALDPRDEAYTQAELEEIRVDAHDDLAVSWPTPEVPEDDEPKKRRLFRRG